MEVDTIKQMEMNKKIFKIVFQRNKKITRNQTI